MDTLHHLVADMVIAMSAIDNLGGQIVAATRHRPDVQADRIELAVWQLRAVLARCHAEDPLGLINHIDERLQSAQER